ncbi:MAG: hypothetical protein A2W91_01370 [Bacteroidetes bacterium GWF2_38_335]|nr:MAG: hypothetical protein A2W91_01370 [Bacteroidetes bacterium GWF2_38_335]OFY80952.1 MAG: hypothetical protein A2281_12895 [Bacteroidetes bacterium RIFOXYA12_FULL_38_20]HBS85113.1 hypothetical protein [Bacteroidales bacterium]
MDTSDILTALAIGIAAGIIDVVPMIIQKLNRTACASAFMQWVFLGLVIPFVAWNIEPWLKGIIIAELALIPVLIIVSSADKKAIIPMLIFSAILGAGVGFAGDYFIG